MCKSNLPHKYHNNACRQDKEYTFCYLIKKGTKEGEWFWIDPLPYYLPSKCIKSLNPTWQLLQLEAKMEDFE